MNDLIRASIQSIASSARLADFADTDSLLDAGVLDSLAIMQLVEALERQFQVKVDIEELLPENFDSIARITAFLATKTSDASIK